MNELDNEFVTQCAIENLNSRHNQNMIELIYNQLVGVNKQKRESLVQIRQESDKEQLKLLGSEFNRDKIIKEKELNKSLKLMEERLLNSILLRKKQKYLIEDQLRLFEQYHSGLPLELRISHQEKAQSLNKYQNGKNDIEEQMRKFNEDLNKKHDLIQSLNQHILQDQLSYQHVQHDLKVLKFNYKEAQNTIKIQDIQISQLDDLNYILLDKIKDQRSLVFQLQVLQKLERMFLTFEETINESQLQEINESSHQVIQDFMDAHPFGVRFLIDSLIQCYRKMQVQMDSLSTQEDDLINYKSKLELNKRELENTKLSYRIFDDSSIDFNFNDLQQLQANFNMKQSQNNFCSNILSKAESFLIKVFSNMMNAIFRFNDIFKIIQSRKIHIESNTQELANRINQFAINSEIPNQLLTFYQFQSCVSDNSQDELFSLIQQSVILKLYVNMGVIQQHLQTKSKFTYLYQIAVDYYFDHIKDMIEIIKQLTLMPKRSKMTFLEQYPIPSFKSKTSIEFSQKRITLSTESKTQLQLNKAKLTKRNSFTTTLGSSRKILPDMESRFIESERKKITNPKQSNSEHITRLSDQQQHCQQLSESERGFEKKLIIQNFKSLVQLRSKLFFDLGYKRRKYVGF